MYPVNPDEIAKLMLWELQKVLYLSLLSPPPCPILAGMPSPTTLVGLASGSYEYAIVPAQSNDDVCRRRIALRVTFTVPWQHEYMGRGSEGKCTWFFVSALDVDCETTVVIVVL